MNWLILRGLIREKRHWGNFPLDFEQALGSSDPKVRVHCLDFPGFGTESSRPSPFRMEGIVDDLRARWRALPSGESPEWGILAISLGGMVAMNWTSRYPQDFKRAVLINSSGAGVSPVYRRMLPANYPGVASMFFKNTLERERTVLELTTHLQGEKLEARARTQAGFAIPVKSRDGIAQITAALVFKTPETLPVPTLILTAKGDRLVDWRCSDDLARRFGAELRIHPTGNHDLSVDDPAWIAREVSDWTRRNPV